MALNVPIEQFTVFGVTPAMATKIDQQQAAVTAAKKQLRELQQQEADAAAAADGSSGSNGGSSGGESEGSVAMTEGVLRTLMRLKGRDRLNAARRLAKRAKQLMAEALDEDQANTWTSFMVGGTHTWPAMIYVCTCAHATASQAPVITCHNPFTPLEFLREWLGEGYVQDCLCPCTSLAI